MGLRLIHQTPEPMFTFDQSQLLGAFRQSSENIPRMYLQIFDIAAGRSCGGS